MDNNFFKGKCAVVTGAGGTLCSEIAIDLAQMGCKVVLIGRTVEKLEVVAKNIRNKGGEVLVATGSVTDEKAMAEIAEKSAKTFGACDILVNGAGGNNIKAMTQNFVYTAEDIVEERDENYYGFFDIDIESFRSVLEVNTLGTVIPSRIFGKQMAKNGGGAILNFASMNTYRPLTRVPAYAMSKCAIEGFTTWLAEYFAPANIRVNAIAPGFFVNERSKKYLCTPEGGLSARGENVMHHTPMKRFGEAKDLLGCMRWLLNDEQSSFVTGVTIPVDGGFLSSSGI